MNQKCRQVFASEAYPLVTRGIEPVLAEIKDKLGLPDLVIAWYGPTDTWGELPGVKTELYPSHWHGFHDSGMPHVVWIKATPVLREAVRVLAHEAKHAWQQKYWGFGDGFEQFGRQSAEYDAERFEREFMTRYDEATAPPKPVMPVWML